MNSLVIKIVDAKQYIKEIVIEVLLYSIDAATNLRFISQYDKSAGDEKKIPSEEQRVRMASSRSVSRKEIHKWILIDGKWLKKEADILLLE